MAEFVTLVTNNDGGHPAILHPSLDAAKAWVREWLTDPEKEPPQSDAERARMDAELQAVRGDFVDAVQGSDAWKEWVYIAPLAQPEPASHPTFKPEKTYD